jgi:hypothetical protein
VCPGRARTRSYHHVAQGRNDEPVQQALRALRGRYSGWGFWKLPHRLCKKGLVINYKLRYAVIGCWS